MPKNKCGECMHEEYCVYHDARSCRGNKDARTTYKFIPKTYINEKEYINQWEEKDETNI